jgi:hypothetical protein
VTETRKLHTLLVRFSDEVGGLVELRQYASRAAAVRRGRAVVAEYAAHPDLPVEFLVDGEVQ